MPLTPMLRVAHLTDLHFSLAPRSGWPHGPDLLRRTVQALNRLDLDAVVLTGDLFDEPALDPEPMRAFKYELRPLRHPWYVALGNHDVEGPRADLARRRLIDGLGDHGLSLVGAPWYSVPLPWGHRLVVLDTTDTGEQAYVGWQGRLGRAQAQWLRRTLKHHRDEHLLVAMHHPPFKALPFTGPLRFEEKDGARVRRALATAGDNMLGALCGHYHHAARALISGLDVHASQALVEHPHHFRVFTWHPGGCDIQWHTPMPVTGTSCCPPRHRARGRLIQSLGALTAPQRAGARSMTRPVVMRRW
ncbi:MAG: metallophosphoesterase [Candidatus Sericytochromatia bacterium]|nr:metallophosphoesterase [Candidatus Sericytochromatia bacterium]